MPHLPGQSLRITFRLVDIEEQRAIVRRVLGHADAGTTQLADVSYTLPVDRYLGSDAAAVPAGGPICLGPEIREPGDHVVRRHGDRELVVVRGETGDVVAFDNACRHRGAPIVGVDGTGARSFTCPFHGWVYDRDGVLIATPRAGDGFDDVDLTGCHLPRHEAIEVGGVVFVGDHVDVGGAAGDLDAFGLAAWQPLRLPDGSAAVWDSTWSANWKLLIDTFLESYHVPRLHQDTVARYYLDRPSTWDEWPDALRFQTSQRSLLEVADSPEDEWNLLERSSVLYLLPPNLVLSFSVDHVAAYWFHPTGPATTSVSCRLYAPADSMPAPDQAARTLALHERVSGGEDFEQQERLHASLATGSLDQVIFGRNEGPAIWFHQWLDRTRR